MATTTTAIRMYDLAGADPARRFSPYCWRIRMALAHKNLSVETIPPMEVLDKHNLATFVRAREGYSWMFLQRDFDQVARMAVPAVFTAYGRQFEGDSALHKKLAGTEEWRIIIVNVRLKASAVSGLSPKMKTWPPGALL